MYIKKKETNWQPGMNNRNSILTFLLYPFSLLFAVVVFFRNFFFDTGIFRSVEFPFPVISVGNITVGGTGKTPHVEHIISILMDRFTLAVVSRGYGRRSSGFVIATTGSTVREVGDEPLQIKRKFPEVEVAVSASRVKGIRELVRQKPGIRAVILDDAFQHRWVKPGISMLLLDYNRPPSADMLLPAGRLRENLSSRKRAAIVIITKCPPGMSPIERRVIRNELNLFPWQSLYFTTYSYGKPIPVFSDGLPFPAGEKDAGAKPAVVMVTGIATPGVFKNHLLGISSRIEQLSYPDHHNFTPEDIRQIVNAWDGVAEEQKVIITTEKDAVRLQGTPGIDSRVMPHMYYIPLGIRFIERNGNEFKKKIIQYVAEDKRDHIISQKGS
jgi:tetraacyldisaccharide 4'-kinase